MSSDPVLAVLKDHFIEQSRQANRHLADIADSLRKIARSLEVTVAIEGGSSIPPLPPQKGEPS